MEIVQEYSSTILALGFMSFLMLCQVIVADVVGLKMKHLPGSIALADHSKFLFRVSRTVANTNETVAIFVLARSLYALCYYFNLQLLRSTVFGVSLFALAALIVLGVLRWL